MHTLATRCDLSLVVGSPSSSNSNRLVEVARRAGCRAKLIEDERCIEPEWLAEASTVGVTAGASALEPLVQRVVDSLRGLGPVEVHQSAAAEEPIHFALPKELR